MFKRVRKDNEVREFYLGKIRLFRYVSSVRFADFVKNSFEQTKRDFDVVYDIFRGGGIAHNKRESSH